MALPNKDQLKFHLYKDAKLLMEATEKRCGGNKESKKVQRTLLKQQYENFLGSSSETIDQTFDRSLPSEWKTHALIWRNKVEIETISLDDYTNSNSSINEADNTAYGVSTAHTQSSPTSVDNLSDAVICAFLANSDSEVDSCSKSCVKAYATLKEQYDNLNSDYNKSQFNLVSYKAGKDTTAKDRAVVSENKGKGANVVKALACWSMKIITGLVPLEDGKRKNSGKLLEESQDFAESSKKGIENQLDHKVKVIRCDNGTEFKNSSLRIERKMLEVNPTEVNERWELLINTPVSTAGPSLDNTVGTINSTANTFEEHLFA
ncbi:hypothetical protein Tco_0265621 [Tanacetum coccineum]